MNTAAAGILALVAAIIAGGALRQRRHGSPPVRRPLTIGLSVVAGLALIASIAVALLPELPPSEGARLRVPTQALSVTLVGFDPKTPPPWPVGNCFELSPLPLSRRRGRPDIRGYHVANMHHENFAEVVKRLGLDTVEVEVRGGCFLVVDPRIPRQWLRERPCPTCTRDPNSFWAKHADRFRAQQAQQ